MAIRSWLTALAVGFAFIAAQAEDGIAVPAGPVKLVANFTAPEGKGPFPAVVIVAGAGPQTRNGQAEMAAALNAHGLAVLRFDKRGCGNSTGDLSKAKLSDLIADATAVVDYLKTRSDVDQKKIALIGLSQGGVISPAIAVKNPNVAAIVLLGAVGMRFDKHSMLQWETEMRLKGADEQFIAQGLAAMPKLFEATTAAKSDEEALVVAKAALAPFVAKGMITQAQADIYAANSVISRDTNFYDPATVLRQVKVPVLALTGSLDKQVLPANLPVIGHALAGNPDVTVEEMPGLNHIFQIAKTGSAEEWGTLNQPGYGNPEMLAKVTAWLEKRLR